MAAEPEQVGRVGYGVDPGPGVDAVVRYAAICGPLDAGEPGLFPTRQCRAAQQVLGVDGAAISVVLDGGMRIPLGASNPEATTAERLQFTLGEGPCLQAHADDRPVLVADVTDPAPTPSDVWPTYVAELLARTHYRAVFALPLATTGLSIGTLNLYRRQPGHLSTDGFLDAQAVADRIFYDLLDSGTFGAQVQPSFRWENTPLAIARTAVWQAVGMLIVQMAVPAADALDLLRAYSYANNRLLDDVAADVTTRTLAFDQLTI